MTTYNPNVYTIQKLGAPDWTAMRLCNDPTLFCYEHLEKICKQYDAQYVVDSEFDNNSCAIFYSSKPHPNSNSRYFAMYLDYETQQLLVTDGSFVEDQEFAGIIADNGDIIFSRSRYDYRVSDDESVWIDGGRDYTRRPLVSVDRLVRLTVHKGRLEVWFDND